MAAAGAANGTGPAGLSACGCGSRAPTAACAPQQPCQPALARCHGAVHLATACCRHSWRLDPCCVRGDFSVLSSFACLWALIGVHTVLLQAPEEAMDTILSDVDEATCAELRHAGSAQAGCLPTPAAATLPAVCSLSRSLQSDHRVSMLRALLLSTAELQR